MNGEEENKKVAEEIVATDLPEEASTPQADEGMLERARRARNNPLF
jgi:hypothetical protein